MTRTFLQAALAVALLGTLALAGCKKQQDQTAITPPPATEPAPMPAEPAPAAATLNVTTIDLGTAVGADNRVVVPTSSFAKGDTIHASVVTDGAAGNLTAKWMSGDQLVNTQDKTVPAGPQVTDFSISKPDGWPAGKYRLEVSSNGMLVQSREFEVR